ncbi:NAD-dependent epimerase/dehydratase family protein [Candidatus Methanoperedens nitratireducens]|uniref:Putative NAD-dependent epimerase/dehydratase n=1 Tax=Candidatus Methanoperedens nitratireducens TaxID=1392998 RepID=A0A284VUW5_9EURY|nr:NAD-dependent epimerase/dehydratase family protein [Candidatus Methanoperedens nitroreducens]SNQ62987.1 putative NAD-dependent epimerase/dehydratase [Candidatus Methanoperedens nitroreducens]
MEASSKINLPDLDGQRVLITGGLGFIGSNLAHKCLELGAEVTVYDCLDPRSGGNMHNVHDIKNSMNIILNDIRNFEGICACIINKDVLFNCAAYTSHPNSMKEPLIDIDVNCKGVINLLEAARRFNPEIKIVHIGTSTQIGKMQYSPIDEFHPEFPVEIYSANKSASEKYVLIYGSAYHMKTTVVRLANNYGPRSNIKSPDFGFMNFFIGLALQDKDITVFGKGSQMRNIAYVEDSVNALILASQSEKSNGEVFFAVSDTQTNVAEIAQKIVQVVGKGRVRYIDWPKEREAIEIGDAVISNEKAKKFINWIPQYELVKGLFETKNYFNSCLDKYI